MKTGTTKKTEKTKKYKLSTEREKALAAFQKARKLQESNDLGYAQCISCGKLLHISEMDGGHYIPRQYRATELLEINVNPQCRTCNRFDYGNQIGYRKGLIAKYGAETEQRLEDLFEAQKGSEEAFERLSQEDKDLVTRKKTAVEYHEIYLYWNKICKQLEDKESM